MWFLFNLALKLEVFIFDSLPAGCSHLNTAIHTENNGISGFKLGPVNTLNLVMILISRSIVALVLKSLFSYRPESPDHVLLVSSTSEMSDF